MERCSLPTPVDLSNSWRQLGGISFTSEQIEAINPNSLTVPAFRWARDAEVTAVIHSAAPVLVRDEPASNPWQAEYLRMFDVASDSALFERHEDVVASIVERQGAAALLDDGRLVYPLIEGKMLWHYDHRYGTYDGQTQAQANKGVCRMAPIRSMKIRTSEFSHATGSGLTT